MHDIIPCSKSDYFKLARAITEFNLDHLPPNSDYSQSMGFVMRRSPWKLIGGITARIVLGKCLDIEILWVEQEYRKQGAGTRLLQAMEQAAQEIGSKLAMVDTFDFQALGFYQKNGYEVFGVLDDCPTPGHKRYYLKKSL